MKSILDRFEISWLTPTSLHISPPIFQKFLACFCCICWVITNLCCGAPSSCSQLNLPDPYLSLICLMSECSELFSIVKYCITHFFLKIENWHGFLLDKARPPCLTMESILWSSTTLVLCGPQTFYANSHIHQITVTWICFIRKLCFHMSKNIYT